MTTGPKTLDELDPLLRGDSVDLDQVEVAEEGPAAAPVSIDSDGNVVGLSGLSELMRQSDAAHAQAAAIARTRAEDSAPPPAGRVTRPAEPGRPASTPRPRRAKPKKKNSSAYLLVGALLLLFAGTIGGVAYILTRPTTTDPIVQNGDGPGTPATGPGATDRADLFPDVPPDTPGTTPDPDIGDADPPPDDADWITSQGGPEDNPDYAYDPDAAPAEIPKPTDVPTVLTVAQPLVHEGWYILSPPRLNVDATGVSLVELSKLEPVTEDEAYAVLSGELLNRGVEAVVSGEAHVALLDSSGRVFAETYLPYAALVPGEAQEVRLSIPVRFWKRARDVRTRVVVFEEAEALDVLADVALQPAGMGDWSSVRVTVRNPHDRWLRDALVVLWAEDVAGRVVARFRAPQEGIFVDPSGWLDIVVFVPLDDSAGPVSWHAQVIQQ
ncbi:hypothetical protein OT109_11030 [Phycisphaeraceae bacterium D3-23]